MSIDQSLPADPSDGTARDQPEPLQGTSLSASLTVTDLSRSLAWYRDVLGFTVVQEYGPPGMPRAVSLSAGVVRILIGRDDGARGVDRVRGEGFSLQITTAQDVDAIANRIKDLGGTLESEPADAWGARVFRVRDPDGFKLVISSER